MRILYLTNSNVPSTAANSVQVMKMCQALARAGHEVELSCRAGLVDAEPFEYYGIEPIFRLTRSPHVAA
ncbi:MAG: group 1 glycosyl transferase, partial [Myxococcales bacterium]|nr:group 1 glycosyl transferase [Myxococcales bacterium]